MSLLFRKSKYSFNSYKVLNREKNILLLPRDRKYPLKPITALLTLTFLGIYLSLPHFVKRLINENNLVKQNFEDRKTKQMSYDFMIYTGSTKGQFNEVEKLSLF
jgi:hypothetical protein